MSHDRSSLLDAIGRIPRGWNVSIEFFNDDAPCVTAKLSRGGGADRQEVNGWRHHDCLETAIARAIGAAVDNLPPD